MPWRIQTVAVLLLALMGLAREHCALEQVRGLEFLACCQHVDKAPHQDNDCDEDDCAAVESGYYQIEDNPTLTPPVAVALAAPASEGVAVPAADSARGAVAVSSAPPGLPRVWQFSYRTALPPRAPSLIA